MSITKTSISLLSCSFFRGSWQGGTFKYSLPLHVSLHFVPLIFFSFSAAAIMAASTFSSFFYLIFPILLLSLSPLDVPPSLYNQCPFHHIASILHHTFCSLSLALPVCPSPLLAAAPDSSPLSPFSSEALPPAESSFDSDNCTRNGKQ